MSEVSISPNPDQERIFLKQNIWSLIIIIATIALVYAVSPKIEFTPHGMAYSWGESYIPTEAKDIQLYEERPYSAQIIGNISAELALSSGHEDQKQVLLDYAKKLAASLGANGVLVTYFAAQERVIIIEGLALRT